jgi:hypothetical protein
MFKLKSYDKSKLTVKQFHSLMKTFWLSINESKQSSRSSASNTNTNSHVDDKELISRMECDSGLDEKAARLASWNTEILLKHLKLIVACRCENKMSIGLVEDWASLSFDTHVFEEVIEIIDLSNLSKSLDDSSGDSNIIEDCVREQLFDFVASVARLYPENAFHNFEHASHVTMVRASLVSSLPCFPLLF